MPVHRHRSSSATLQSTIVPGISNSSFILLIYLAIRLSLDESTNHSFHLSISGKLVPLSPVGATIPNGKGAVLRCGLGGYPPMLI